MRSEQFRPAGAEDKTFTMEHGSYFHLSTKIGTLYFKECEITSAQAFIAVCLTALVVSVLYECLRYSRAWLMNRPRSTAIHRSAQDNSSRTSNCSCDDDFDVQACDAVRLNTAPPKDDRLSAPRNKPLSGAHVTQTLLHLLQVTLGYLFMLSVMTYQVLLGGAIVLGAGLGYLFFASFMVRDLPPRKRSPIKLQLGKMAATGSEETTQELLHAQI